MISIIVILLTATNTPLWSLIKAQECKPAFEITGRKPPLGMCNQENDSQCCVPGQNYTAYWCSLAVTNRTAGILNVSGFEKGQDGGSPGECDNNYHSDDTPVVALSTGWYDFGSRCGQVINISGNGRFALAVVVDECNSYSGCDAPNDYQPPCPYNVLAASKAVWVALGAPENSPLFASGKMNVTWAPTNEKNPIRDRLSRRRRYKIIIGVVLGVVLAALMSVCLVLFINKRRRRKQFDAEQWDNSLVILSELPKRFTYKELKLATRNFDKEKKLGSGGFGSVFEGTLNDEVQTRVAIKRLEYFKQGKKEFLTEVKTTGRIHHFNLVKLVGFCVEKEHRLLVYEYMPNGSLDKWIFSDDRENCSLNWGTRKKIILHIAKGLSYLHEDCQSKIIHLDIKPQNILLDQDFNAKLADFGLATLIDKEESFAATQMRGTRGYLAPEWLTRRITEKVDVYSCGIVMLEVIFQRRNFDVHHDHQDQETPTLVQMVREAIEANRLFEVIREYFDDEETRTNGEEIEKMIKLAMWCLQAEPTGRPSMSTVVKVLEGAIALEPMIIDFSTNYPNTTVSETTTSGGISSNATYEISSMTYPR